MKHFQVTAAVFQKRDQYLALQRGLSKYDYISYKYEFPGGKMEPSETKEEALKRELHEEMHISVDILPEMHFMTVEHEYPDFKVTMDTYLIQVDVLDFILKEHLSYEWLSADQLDSVDFAEADLPIVEAIKKK